MKMPKPCWTTSFQHLACRLGTTVCVDNKSWQTIKVFLLFKILIVAVTQAVIYLQFNIDWIKSFVILKEFEETSTKKKLSFANSFCFNQIIRFLSTGWIMISKILFETQQSNTVSIFAQIQRIHLKDNLILSIFHQHSVP